MEGKEERGEKRGGKGKSFWGEENLTLFFFSFLFFSFLFFSFLSFFFSFSFLFLFNRVGSTFDALGRYKKKKEE